MPLHVLHKCRAPILPHSSTWSQFWGHSYTMEWAQRVGEVLACAAQHNRSHAQWIAAKCEALGLEQTPAHIPYILRDKKEQPCSEFDCCRTALFSPSPPIPLDSDYLGQGSGELPRRRHFPNEAALPSDCCVMKRRERPPLRGLHFKSALLWLSSYGPTTTSST